MTIQKKSLLGNAAPTTKPVFAAKAVPTGATTSEPVVASLRVLSKKASLSKVAISKVAFSKVAVSKVSISKVAIN